MNEIKFVLTTQETDVVMNCLAEQPFKVVHGVISKMLAQANSEELQKAASFTHQLPPLTHAPADAPAPVEPPVVAALPTLAAHDLPGPH